MNDSSTFYLSIKRVFLALEMNKNSTNKHKLSQALAYFDIFNHPLSKDELANLAGITPNEVKTTINELIEKKVCSQFSEFYSLSSNIDSLLHTRLNKEKQAVHYYQKLPRYAKLISSFPYVRSIGISGSLSKGVMHDNGDIDYFIITAPNRMWVCRTFLILFKKIFLLNSKKYFCINYLVDENHLEIIDKNIFTAVEVSYLLPVYNKPLIDQLKATNTWTKSYFPFFKHPRNIKPVEAFKPIKWLVEKLLNGVLGERLDLFFMRTTYKRWGKKFKHFDPQKLQLTMRSDRGVSKHHPRDFQQKVLAAYQDRIDQINANS